LAQSEFELIGRYFSRLGAQRSDVRIGVGDDGAVLVPPASRELVVVTDSLVEGVHFPPGSPAASIGHRAFAVNLSDIAAMGAEAAWALLALTLPEPDEHWLQQFARAAGDLCRRHGVSLVGGDTTRGPLSITVTIIGIVPIGVALERKGAQAGDAIFVTGSPGDSAAGLALEQNRLHVVDPMSAQILRWPAPASIFPTVSGATWRSSARPAVAVRKSTRRRCRSPTRWSRRWVVNWRANTRSPAARTTNYCSRCRWRGSAR
jgi:thiamine-monophosphate kinase